MTKSELQGLEDRIKGNLEQADRIMNGDSEYDGADGARAVQEVCDMALVLINELRKHVTE